MSGYGPPSNIPPTTPMPAAPRQAGREPAQMVGYLAGMLGLLSFVWGFLSWFSQGGAGFAGYSIAGSGAGAVIGLSIVAGLLAAVDALDKRASGALPAALAVAAFLVALGLLIGKSPSGEGVGVGVGLILELITTLVQAVGLAYVWLVATGRMRAPQTRAAAGGWPGQSQAQSHGQPQGQQPYQYGPAAPPPGQFAPQPPPGGYAPAPTQYGAPQPSAGYPPATGPGQQAGQQSGAAERWSQQQPYPGSAQGPGGSGEQGEHGPANP